MAPTPEPRQVLKNGRPAWLVDLRGIGGGRMYFRELEAAKRARAGAIRDHARLGNLAFELSHEDRVHWLSIQRKLAEAGTTIDEVVRFWERSHRASTAKTVGDAVKECVEAKRSAGGRRGALLTLWYGLRSFAESVGAGISLSDVTIEQVQNWLSNPKWSLRTRRGKLIDLSSFYTFAMKRGWAARNLAQSIEPIRYDAQPIGILTVEQVERLLKVTREQLPEFLPFIVLGVFCGVRPEEIKQLSWSNVNLDTGYLEIPAHVAKRSRNGGSRARRLVQLQPNAIAWLKLGGTLPPIAWDNRFDRVREAAGFAVSTRKLRVRKIAKRGTPWPKNGMRHSFCSYCIPVFGELKESEWAGHSPQVAISRYRALVTVEEARRFWAIMPA